MIEIVYKEGKENEKKDTEAVSLPKNIRQIGSPGEKKKIYMEDYVISYINQMTTQDSTFFHAAILLGNIKKTESGTYIFVSGAIDASEIKKEGQGIKFTEYLWTNLYDTIKRYFDHSEIVGWFLSMPGYSVELTDEMNQVHRENFAGNDKIFLLYDPIEKDENMYSFEYGTLVKQSGYYIYYERNEAMQEYMVSFREQRDAEPIENVKDEAIKHFREIIRERKEESHQKKIMRFMYATCTFLVMTVVAIGITMINNYDKMRQMQASLSDISKAVARQNDGTGWSTSDQQKALEEENKKALAGANDAIPVENVSGQVKKEDNSSAQAAQTQQSAQADQTTQAAQTGDSQSSPTKDQNAAKASEDATANQPPEGTDTAKSTNDTTSTQASAAPKVKEPTRYVVAKGDTLITISMRFYGTRKMVSAICAQNGISDRDEIKEGQKLLLP